MTPRDTEVAPVRGEKHQALAVFLGHWKADGESFGSSNQPVGDPRSVAEPWVSTHTGT